MNTSETGVSQLQVKFATKQSKYAISDSPFYVPSNITTVGLNKLLNELISKNGSTSIDNNVQFSFLIHDEILLCKLGEHLTDHKISTEHEITIEYVEATPSPEPLNCLEHDDWVSAVHTSPQWILTGCYDNSVHIWSTDQKHKHLLSLNGHSGPVKAVSWLGTRSGDNGSTIASFISASHDQTVLLWEWNVNENLAKSLYIYRGHERSVDSISAKPNDSTFVTGSWDGTLKIWSTDPNAANNQEEVLSKKRKGVHTGGPLIRVPKMTLKGHHEAISTVQWLECNEIMSASWDHTLKIWDAEYGGFNVQLATQKAVFNAHYSRINKLIIACGPDRHIRLYDPKSQEGSIVKKSFTSHKEWVQCVRWSDVNEYLFVSGSYDHDLKLWDTRSYNAPLYDLIGHEDKILCCDWSKPELIVSGGADSTLRLFTAK